MTPYTKLYSLHSPRSRINFKQRITELRTKKKDIVPYSQRCWDSLDTQGPGCFMSKPYNSKSAKQHGSLTLPALVLGVNQQTNDEDNAAHQDGQNSNPGTQTFDVFLCKKLHGGLRSTSVPTRGPYPPKKPCESVRVLHTNSLRPGVVIKVRICNPLTPFHPSPAKEFCSPHSMASNHSVRAGIGVGIWKVTSGSQSFQDKTWQNMVQKYRL